jgi:hypothetical protein
MDKIENVRQSVVFSLKYFAPVSAVLLNVFAGSLIDWWVWNAYLVFLAYMAAPVWGCLMWFLTQRKRR